MSDQLWSTFPLQISSLSQDSEDSVQTHYSCLIVLFARAHTGYIKLVHKCAVFSQSSTTKGARMCFL